MATWNEADHPRDDEGKFTYKNGDSSGKNSNTLLYGGIEYNDADESIEDKLYKNTTSKEKLLNYRNKLLNILGDSLEREEILYSDHIELENKILNNTISKIKLSKERLVNSVKKISKPEFKSDKDTQRVINKAKNTYEALNNLEMKIYSINGNRKNAFGEDMISGILRYKKSIENECNETIIKVENIKNQNLKKANYLTNPQTINKSEIPVNQITKNQEQYLKQVPINPGTKIENKNTSEKASSETTTDWIMPVKGRITSHYGWRMHPITKKQTFHSGIDISVPVGTDIKSIADGKVYFSGKGDPQGYAHFIIIDHGIINGVNVTSEYGHLSQHLVSNGQKIKKGQVIAKSGNEGRSSGPHLHLTIREGFYKGKHVSPSKYIEYQ